jgi:uncharacterized protein with von Willebrand factor type A (vWA) domain
LAPAIPTQISALAREMRVQGARIGVGELLAAHRALQAVDAGRRKSAYHALRPVLCSGPEDLPRFELAFRAVFGAPEVPDDPIAAGPQGGAAALDAGGAAEEDDAETGEREEVLRSVASSVELLRTKDFAELSEDELLTVRSIIERLVASAPMRRARRTRPTAQSRGHAVDLRATVRRSLRTGGLPTALAWRERDHRPRRVVLVCDVSGSMEPYARVLLQFLGAWVRSGRPVEAFAFGTRLTRITLELRLTDAQDAVRRATERVTDWGGGTRIGESIAALNRRHGRHVGRGAVVIVLSDGWERGDPDQLRAELAHLRRSAHRLIWLNPHAADPEFEPLARGMRAALPSTDELLAGNSIASLEALADLLRTVTDRAATAAPGRRTRQAP